METLNGKSFGPVNYCIYCGSEQNLSKEHILPFGLNGSATLLKASCGDCSKVTGEIERRLLRGSFQAVRIYRELQSRSKFKNASKTEVLKLVIKGKKELIPIPITEYPIIFPFPVFETPTFLTKEALHKGIKVKGILSTLYGPSPNEIMKKYGATEIELSQSQDPVSFARMIAKISYSFAYAKGELDNIVSPSSVVEEFMKADGAIGKYVGTLQGPITKHKNILHRLFVHTDKEKGLLIGEVQLFADSETPSYGVILGKLKGTT